MGCTVSAQNPPKMTCTIITFHFTYTLNVSKTYSGKTFRRERYVEKTTSGNQAPDTKNRKR